MQFGKTIAITIMQMQRNKTTRYIRMFTLYSIHERTVVFREGVAYTLANTLSFVHAMQHQKEMERANQRARHLLFYP